MLFDPWGRRIDYLRLSVTDRCDLRCSYCLPAGFKEFRPHDERLAPEEMARIVAAFARLGVRHVRLTGGEPLVRRDIVDIVRRLAALPGVDDLSMSSNGLRLGAFSQSLFEAGLRRVNVSLDSLRADRFARITGGGSLESVLAGLAAARLAGLAPIRVNAVMMGGVNDDEAEELVDYCAGNGFTLRFIETMPVGEAGRAMYGSYVDLRDIRRRLERRFPLVPDAAGGGGPARYLRIADSETRIGFITPISRHFCDTCNRVRLAADGTLHMCLDTAATYDLRPLLNAGADVDTLCEAVREAIRLKPQRHSMDRAGTRPLRPMSSIGG